MPKQFELAVKHVQPLNISILLFFNIGVLSPVNIDSLNTASP